MKRPQSEPGLPKFAIGDKVVLRQLSSLGALEVIGIGPELLLPDKGLLARRIYWRSPPEVGQEDWTWDFALEEWK